MILASRVHLFKSIGVHVGLQTSVANKVLNSPSGSSVDGLETLILEEVAL